MKNVIVYAILIISSFVMYLLIARIIASYTKKTLKVRKDGKIQRNSYVQKALPYIVSCNSYPLLALVFRNLEYDIKKYDIVVKDGFRGYFKNEERTI